MTVEWQAYGNSPTVHAIDAERKAAKGDRCRILSDYKVEHYDCDEWADGVVTDVRTGKRVEK